MTDFMGGGDNNAMQSEFTGCIQRKQFEDPIVGRSVRQSAFRHRSTFKALIIFFLFAQIVL